MRVRRWPLLVALLSVACGTPVPEDAGPPDLGALGPDQGGMDLGAPDLGVDGGPDAGPDGGPDFGLDAGPAPFPFAMCLAAPNPRGEDCASTCGNGRLDDGPVADSCRRRFGIEGEACDGTELGTETCESLGYRGGRLRCNACCALDAADCTGRCGLSVATDGCSTLRRATVAPEDLAAASAAGRVWVAHLENGGAWLTRIDPNDLERQVGIGCLEVDVDSLDLVTFDDRLAMAVHTVDGRVELFTVDGAGFNEGPLIDERRGSHFALATHPEGLVLVVAETFGLRVLLIASDGSITWNRFIAGAVDPASEAPVAVAVAAAGGDILVAAVSSVSAVRVYPITAAGDVGRARSVAETATRVELYPRSGGAWIRYDGESADQVDLIATDATPTAWRAFEGSDVSAGTVDRELAIITLSSTQVGGLELWQEDLRRRGFSIWNDARRPVLAALAELPGDDLLVAVGAADRYLEGAVDARSIVGGVVLARVSLDRD